MELIEKLQNKSDQIKKEMFEMCVKAGTGHITSSLSCIDLLVVLYYGDIMKVFPHIPECKERDIFIMSKGQASPALYTVLGNLEYFDKSKLKDFAQKNGCFGVHLQHDVPGVEITTGSLGHGFGVATGMALGYKTNRELNLIFTLLGDGELYEGSIWETAMFASHNNLNNLIAIVDRNHLCVTDFTENLVELESLEKKWESFGWDVISIDGHDIEQIYNTFKKVRRRKSRKPLVIIADTEKGCGIDFMSNIPLWHAVVPSCESEIKICKEQLERSCNNG